MNAASRTDRRVIVLLLVVASLATAFLSRDRGCAPCAAAFCELPAGLAATGNRVP